MMMTNEDATDMVRADAAAAHLAAWTKYLEERRVKLAYIRDIRDMLAMYGVAANGDTAESYRRRWSKLCRDLCVNGVPMLADVSAGNELPVGVFN